MKYRPTNNLIDGLRNMFPLEISPWDTYYMRMAQTDFLCGRLDTIATKSFFIRKAPFGGSFAILGGLSDFLRILADFNFNNNEVISALIEQGYKKEFIDYLKAMHKLDITVYSIPEGSVFFPNEPAIVLKGNIISIRIAEGILLKCVNYPTLSITKWNRVVQAGTPGNVLEFARRRSQDDLRTSLYAYLGGVRFSSNANIRSGFNIETVGTMGHEWVQSFNNEYEAFDKWLEHNPDKPVLLVDTIDTLKSGVPNAIRAFKKHWNNINRAGGIPGIRNDSNDLAYLTIEERIALNKAGLSGVLIYETNDLDEYSIEDIKGQIFINAPKTDLDPIVILSKIVWGCGTNPGTCSDQPSLGGVAKLTSMEGKAVIKIAKNNPIKTSIPGFNFSSWVVDKDNWNIICCVIHDSKEKVNSEIFDINDESKITDLKDKNVLIELRQKLVFKDGEIRDNPTLNEVRERVKSGVSILHWTNKRFKMPEIIKVGLTENLFKLRKNLILNNKLMED